MPGDMPPQLLQRLARASHRAREVRLEVLPLDGCLRWLRRMPCSPQCRQESRRCLCRSRAPTTASASTGSAASSCGQRPNQPHPYRRVGPLSDGWTLAVVSVTPNATSLVLAENQFNDPPAPGRQFFIARVMATFTGAGSDAFAGSFRLEAVGASNVAYTTFDDSCGVIPDEISSTDVFTGGAVTGNVCWSVLSSDVPSLVMFDTVGATPGPFMALH